MFDLIAGGAFDSGGRASVPCPLCAAGRHDVALTAGNHNFAFLCSGKRLLGGYGFGEPSRSDPMDVSIIEDERRG